MPKIKAVIFDMDGTIFDTERIGWEAFVQVMAEYGYRADLDEFVYHYEGSSMEDITNRISYHFGEEIPSVEIWQKKRDVCNERLAKEGVPIKTGIKELLEYLNSVGVKCILGSSTDMCFVKERLKLTDFDKYFYDLVSGDMVAKRKPSPDIFLKACELAGVKEDEAIVIEDSTNGVMAGVNAKIPTISIQDLLPLKPEVQSKCIANFKDGFAGIEWFKRNFN